MNSEPKADEPTNSPSAPGPAPAASGHAQSGQSNLAQAAAAARTAAARSAAVQAAAQAAAELADANPLPLQPGVQAASTSYVDPSIQLEATVVELEAKAATLEGQVRDLTDRLLRTHAEMDNIRKRQEREKQDMAKYAITKFAHDVVEISDNFHRAKAAVKPDAEPVAALKGLLDGVDLTERAFLAMLEKHGVKRVDPMGELFNPNFHQAVMETQDANVPAGTVLQVFSTGYVIEDRVLRPAMVVVAKGGSKPGKPAADAKPADAVPPPGDGPAQS
jgi:molecular chaperone GrpE